MLGDDNAAQSQGAGILQSARSPMSRRLPFPFLEGLVGPLCRDVAVFENVVCWTWTQAWRKLGGVK